MSITSYLLVVLGAFTFIHAVVKPVRCAVPYLGDSSQQLPRKLGAIAQKSLTHVENLTKDADAQLEMHERIYNPEDIQSALLSTEQWHTQSKWIFLPKGLTPPSGPAS
ncbi:hypothetical protein O6H91_05G048500 [Diphasiastrum complanatum]|uniref:Uncharacterized protein n=1 Tax=Diphasiastrum complanatum TaxID=34168 RepID=A0ACC2DN23_DIPCM|nr:hypothetical protein O6H91_05G048500 [Diphasiastrum complanatum]